MQSLLFRKLPFYKLLGVTLSYFLIILISSGIFFIRDDWPFGFNGSYLVVLGLLIFLSLGFVHLITKHSLTKIGLFSGLFIFWFAVSVVNVSLFAVLFGEPRASIFLLQEFIFIFLIFFSGFLTVKYLRFSPLQALLIATVWVLISTFAIVESLLAVDAVRRVNALASLNYMASSFGAFFVMSLGVLIVAWCTDFRRKSNDKKTDLSFYYPVFFTDGSIAKWYTFDNFRNCDSPYYMGRLLCLEKIYLSEDVQKRDSEYISCWCNIFN